MTAVIIRHRWTLPLDIINPSSIIPPVPVTPITHEDWERLMKLRADRRKIRADHAAHVAALPVEDGFVRIPTIHHFPPMGEEADFRNNQ